MDKGCYWYLGSLFLSINPFISSLPRHLILLSLLCDLAYVFMSTRY